jgi:hypothetical protein
MNRTKHKRDTDAGDPAAEQKHGFHERSLSITEPITEAARVCRQGTRGLRR